MGDVEVAEIYNNALSAYRIIARNVTVQSYLIFINKYLSGSGFKLIAILSNDIIVIR